MKVTNSDLRDWLRSIGINLCDTLKEDDLLSQIAVEFCKQLGLDPDEFVRDGNVQCSRSTLYEAQARSFLSMLRAVHVVFNREAGEAL